MAEHRSTLKSNQNTHCLRFGFTPTANPLKRGFVFTVFIAVKNPQKDLTRVEDTEENTTFKNESDTTMD